MIPAALAFGAIPLSIPVYVEAFEWMGQQWGPYKFPFQAYEIGIGIVFVLGVSSLAAYALLLAGYGSANKYGKPLKDFPRRGHVGLQDHHKAVWFRTVRIREL